MGMFNFVLDSIKGELFDFKVKRRVYVASTVKIEIDRTRCYKRKLNECFVSKGCF